MNIKAIVPQHGYKIIVVPDENLPAEVGRYKTITDQDGDVYDISDQIQYKKGEFLPSSLLLLAIGQNIEPDLIFKKYEKSNRLIFFICKENQKHSIG